MTNATQTGPGIDGRQGVRLPNAALLGFLVVVLIAFAVRFHHLDAQSLWNDEGNSLRLAQRSPGDLVDAAGRDIHPPGYYLLLKAWTGAAGESEFSLRSLSALQGMLTVAVAVALGRALFERAAGLLAGLVVALSPFAVWYSQETRMYAQLGLLSAASMWAFVLWLRQSARQGARSARRWALLLALVNAAGLYTQYSFPFTLLAQGGLFAAWVGWQMWQTDRGAASSAPTRAVTGVRPVSPVRAILTAYLALNALTLALFLPWLPTAWDQVISWPRTGEDLALAEQLRAVLTWLTYGHTAGDVGWLRFLWPGALVLAALWPLRRDRHLPHTWRTGLPLAWAGIAVAALFLSGAYRAANLKFLLPAQVAVALLIGAGAVRLWDVPRAPAHQRRTFGLSARETRAIRRMLAVVLLFLVVIGQANALHALYNDPAYARDDYRAMAAAIQADPRPGDAILLNAPNQAEVFTYYYDGDAPVYGLPRGLGGDDAATRADVLAVLAEHRRVFVLFWGEAERDPNRVVAATLDAHAYPVASDWYGDVRLALYAVLGETPSQPAARAGARFGPSITLTGYALSAETMRPGDVLGVTLFWQTDVPLDTRYGVTVQLLTPDNTLVNQHDAEPGNNRAPTTTWQPGQTIIDPHGLVVPPDLPPGKYPVIVGVYHLTDPLDRLLVTVNDAPDGAPDGDVFALPPLTVQ